MTRDRALALDWLTRFEGAGLDGVVAKPASGIYQPDKRAMIKVKHARTAECVVAGFRWHKSGSGVVGSLLLGLYDDAGVLQHVGVDLVVHDANAARACARNLHRCARMRCMIIRGRNGRGRPRSRVACPEHRAAGARGRTFRGSRCGSSGSVRSSTITCKAIAFDTRQSSYAGAPTSGLETVGTISSK